MVFWDVEFEEAVFEWLTGLEEESFVQEMLKKNDDGGAGTGGER